MNVFVYGSLCKHQEDHHYIEKYTCLSEQASVKGRLFSNSYVNPHLIKDELHMCYGELYEVDEEKLGELDDLHNVAEKNPQFKRESSTVLTEQGLTQAEVFYWSHSPEGSPVPNNDWKVHQYFRQGSIQYFAYGSCMDDYRLTTHGVESLFKDVRGSGVLYDYELAFSCHYNDGSRADIKEKKGSKLEGVVYENIKEDAISYLYQREGVDSKVYRPTIVDVLVDNEKRIQVLLLLLSIRKRI
ncbi:Uncharacterized conserved protein YtfP, gamma-glutamylcyclotransferase (GGCT)/AIG2-like family [Halobacillus dabanensis]|uniref:Uncharacterized conserved protein YtfP, gamma-glutamylcyclotransferase (GGCT)/AIG2-like family n=1 Tax=Halobacillus dabanensis TaxID=240302 RepID=A0A1I3VTP0_HALDA|nr:gamma-glutamylcyclotransferase [Halobacillus dabanensis]SFJ98489.1 Uncharacterized conserved protein YtfP, gamma-glutamylcyclotransferase (GGCT)/AIG2-like family [Halobacillus dabanensis]